jgi:hypothetical protein
MKKNMSSADRIIRTLIAAILITLYFTNVLSGTIGIVLVVFSVIFILSSILGYCPMYSVFGISSCPTKKA